MLPPPRPLRTACMSFPISSSSLSNAPFGDAAWPRLTRGYGLAGDSWDATTPDWPRRLNPLSSARRCGDCASLQGCDGLLTHRTDAVLLPPKLKDPPPEGVDLV